MTCKEINNIENIIWRECLSRFNELYSDYTIKLYGNVDIYTLINKHYPEHLDNVKKIELYNFNFKDNCVNTNDKNQLGFIAQEVQQVYPKAVEVGRMTLDNNQGINDLLTLNTTQIKYTLYGAVKNLIERVENIESRSPAQDPL
jgi:hypothetical protein